MELRFCEQDIEVLTETIAAKVFERLQKMIYLSKPNPDPLLSVNELCKYLDVKASWIYQRVHSKDIPYLKIGNKLRFKKSEIDKIMVPK